jgi:hypothetical protein
MLNNPEGKGSLSAEELILDIGGKPGSLLVLRRSTRWYYGPSILFPLNNCVLILSQLSFSAIFEIAFARIPKTCHNVCVYSEEDRNLE